MSCVLLDVLLFYPFSPILRYRLKSIYAVKIGKFLSPILEVLNLLNETKRFGYAYLRGFALNLASTYPVGNSAGIIKVGENKQ